jgi:hypothetical protein
MSQLALCFYDIVRAHERMAKLAHRAPVLTFSTADESYKTSNINISRP